MPHIKNYARQNGFEASTASSKPSAKFLKCHYSGNRRNDRKNMDPSKQKNKPSKKTNCQWQVNINFSNAKGAYITKLVNQHNHTITNDDKFFHSNKLIDTKLIKEIKIYAKEYSNSNKKIYIYLYKNIKESI